MDGYTCVYVCHFVSKVIFLSEFVKCLDLRNSVPYKDQVNFRTFCIEERLFLIQTLYVLLVFFPTNWFEVINLIMSTTFTLQWVLCDRCQNWQHRVCGLYNDKRDSEGKAEYICPKCCLIEIESGGRHPLPVTAAFGAKNLPSTNLSDHLERRLLRRLKQEREEMAKFLGKKLEEVTRNKYCHNFLVCFDTLHHVL